MRFLKFMVVVVLVLSVIGNVFLFYKTERLRPQMTINGKKVTRKEYHDWLEQHYGPPMMAWIVKHDMVLQAAAKAGMAPTDAEIDKQMQDQVEVNPRLAGDFKLMSWKKKDVRDEIETGLALANLTIKDVKASEDELKEFYAAAPNRWDLPTKLHTKTIKAADPASAAKAKQAIEQLMRPSSDPSAKVAAPDLGSLVEQFKPKLELPFGDGTWVLWKPVGGPSGEPLVRQVATMKPGEVRVIPIPNGGGATLVVALESIEMGKKGSFTDPETRKRVERDFKMTRATPAQEVLRTLWDSSDIQTDPPAAKAQIERLLLPERIRQEIQATGTP